MLNKLFCSREKDVFPGELVQEHLPPLWGTLLKDFVFPKEIVQGHLPCLWGPLLKERLCHKDFASLGSKVLALRGAPTYQVVQLVQKSEVKLTF